MPILKHAKKKLKQDKKRTILNKKVKTTFKAVVKKAKEDTNPKSLTAAFKGIDKAVKSNLIHKNKAARMKSSLSKMLGGSKAKRSSSATSASKSKTAKTKTSAKTKSAAKAKTASKTTKKTTATKKASPKKK